MTEDYVKLIPEDPTSISPMPLEVKKNEQRTPKRTTTEYQTTGIFKDISEEIQDTTDKSVSG
jgi:hypothetical protein